MKKRQYFWLILFLVLIHLVLLNSFFPIKELFSNKLITTTDYPIHYTMIELFKHGYSLSLFNLFYLGDLKLLSVVFYLLPVLYLQKFYVFLALFFMPFFFYLSAKELFNNKKLGLISGIFGIFIVNFSLTFKDYLLWGVFPYVFSCVITLTAISNFIAFQKRKNMKNLILSLVFFAWSLSIHPMPIFYYLIFGIAYSMVYFKGLKQKLLPFLFLISIFLFPLILGGQASIYYQAEGLRGLISILSIRPIFTMFFILGFTSLSLCFNKKDKKFWAIFLFLMVLLVYFLGLISMFRTFQLQRIILIFFILILLSVKLFEKINLKMALALFIIIVSLILAGHEISGAYSKHLDFGLSNDMTSLKEYFEENNHLNVWFEFSTKLIYGGNSQRLFSYWLEPNKAIITRKVPDKNNKPDFYFCDSRFQNRSIENVSWNVITNLTKKYNISHVVYWSNSSKKVFNPRLNHTCFEMVCVGALKIQS